VEEDFSFSLQLELAKQLGLDPSVYHNFSPEDLRKIKKINIPLDHDSIKGIELLPNLEEITIGKLQHGAVTAFSVFNTDLSIDNADLDLVKKCKKLKKLAIINQPNLSKIDLTGLPNITHLQIVQNNKLKRIKGLKSCPALESFSCYGNKNLPIVEDLGNVILKQKHKLKDLELDLLTFPQAIGYQASSVTSQTYKASEAFNHQILTALNQIDSIGRVQWLESFPQAPIRLRHDQMLKMHNKACEILDLKIPRTAGTRDTVIGIERWLAQNVTYDAQGMQQAQYKHTQNGRVQGPAGGTNSTYNALMYQSCVCEGYTRAEQYLLALRGIKSYNVYCTVGKDTKGFGDSKTDMDHLRNIRVQDGFHSIIRISDYYNLYSDPCWNAVYYQKGCKDMPYTLITKEEMKRDHTLSLEERHINNNVYLERSAVEKSILNNVLFTSAVKVGLDYSRDPSGTDLRGAVPIHNRIPKTGGR
jgi:hypothetical protein